MRLRQESLPDSGGLGGKLRNYMEDGKMNQMEEQFGMKVVEQLGKEKLFTSEELKWMEDYLSGKVGDEALEKFQYRDLTDLAEPAILHHLYVGMLEQERETALRLGKLVFAMGEASSYPVFSLTENRPQEQRILLEPSKKAAVYAAILGGDQRRLRPQEIEKLIEIAEHNAENLKKAMRYQGGKESCGMLVLLMAYFYMKYPGMEEGTGVEGEDAPLMERYEDLVTGLIGQIYPESFSEKDAEKVVAAVREDRMEEIRELLVESSVGDTDRNRYFLCMLSGVSFVNYGLSIRLKNTVSLCLAADWDIVLNFIDMLDVRKELKGELGGSFDEVFCLDAKDYIQWAARNRKIGILEKQLQRNQKAFLEYMNAADGATYRVMEPVVEKAAPELLPKRVNTDKSKTRLRLIEAFTARSAFSPRAGDYVLITDCIRKYLNGEGGIELVYACKGISENGYYWWDKVIKALKNYREKYGYDELGNRCDTLALAGKGYEVFRDFRDTGCEINLEEVKRVFKAADKEGLNLTYQLGAYAHFIERCDARGPWVKRLDTTIGELFREYFEERREEALTAFGEVGSVGRNFGLKVMAKKGDECKESILSYAQDSAKVVRETLLEILYEKKGWEEEVVGLLSSKKASERDLAIRVLAKWKDEAQRKSDGSRALSEEDSQRYTSILAKALESEKNAKVRALLDNVLSKSAAYSEGGKVVTREELVEDIHKGNKKRTLAWAYETPFSKVHRKDGTVAEEEYMQAILLSYSILSPCGISQSAISLAEDLNEKELEVYANELFDKWMDAGAEAKKRWVLYAAAIHGGEEMIRKLHIQIQEWPKAARGAIASEAVQAMALSPNPLGLRTVEGISRKFKFKQVRAAAEKALDYAASQLGITKEELADRIVPNLGFDEHMRRTFDYGERKFTVTVTTALEIEVFDEKGKKLKNLPSPGKKDDPEKASASYEAFKQMKKQMKETITGQKVRLETAVLTGRKWSVRAWKELFVKNPIMHQFAIGLIWGMYEGQKLVSVFRYMEDGTFNTEKEEEFILPEEAGNPSAHQGQQNCQSKQSHQSQVIGRDQVIGLVHPIELSEESINAWKEQLADYEIIQPIEQLDRQIYYRTEEEGKQKELERFGGLILNDLSLGGKLTSQGWNRGEAEERGIFFTYYREDKGLGLGAVLFFSGSFMGGANEDVTVYEIRFYEAGHVPVNSYDRKIESDSLFLTEVPERYFSEIALQVARATASSTGMNAKWKKSR